MPARLPRTPSALSTLPSLIILGNVMRTLAMPKVAEPWWSESASAPNMGVFTLDGVGLLFYGGQQYALRDATRDGSIAPKD